MDIETITGNWIEVGDNRQRLRGTHIVHKQGFAIYIYKNDMRVLIDARRGDVDPRVSKYIKLDILPACKKMAQSDWYLAQIKSAFRAYYLAAFAIIARLPHPIAEEIFQCFS